MNKTYTYNGKDYKFKTVNLDYTQNVFKIQRKALKHIRETTFETEIQVKKYEKDIKSPEYLYWLEKYEEDKKLAENEYYTNPNNLKEILILLVDGDVENIEISSLYGDELTEFFKFTGEVLQDFFSNSKGNAKKLKKYRGRIPQVLKKT